MATSQFESGPSRAAYSLELNGWAYRPANDRLHAIAIEVWRNCKQHFAWSIGRYVTMPDHVHLFAYDNQGERTLSGREGHASRAP
jgi:hypothetical protein